MVSFLKVSLTLCNFIHVWVQQQMVQLTTDNHKTEMITPWHWMGVCAWGTLDECTWGIGWVCVHGGHWMSVHGALDGCVCMGDIG